MEWDKIWSLNRKILDKECCRYTGLQEDKIVTLKILDTDEKYFEPQEVSLHPKISELGSKLVTKSNTVIIEEDDLADLDVGKKLILL